MKRYQLKRKTGRRAIAVLLSLVLILSCSGITAFAADIPETAAEVVGEEKPDVSSEAPDQGELSDEDMPADEPADETVQNEEEVTSEHGTEEAAGEELNDEKAGTPSENAPAQEGSEGEAAETASETSPEQEGTVGEAAEQQPSDEYSDEYIEEVPEEEVSEETALGEVTTATRDGGSGDWAELQALLNQENAEITLDKPYYATEEDSCLKITEGSRITLDLHHYDIDRGLADAEAQEDGCVIINYGTLTIKNSGSTGTGGSITGGNNTGNGGGIVNYGTLILEGGHVTGNKAGASGGGIYNYGSLTMTGGSISYNTAIGWHGGGIYNEGTLTLTGGQIQENEALGKSDNGSGQGGGILQKGTMNVSGDPIVKDNTAQKGDNIYLRAEHPTMNVDGEFMEGANLRVTSATGTGIITSGYGEYNSAPPEEYFTCDEEYYIHLVGDEAAITTSNTTVSYIKRCWEGGKVVSEEAETYGAIEITSATSMTNGWYYLNSNITINDRVCLTGDTSLILGDGFTLDVEGLYIPDGSTLTIYAQSDGENAGRLISEPDGGAGIGGYSGQDNGKIVIHGGNITATGHDHCAGIGSNDGKTTGSIVIFGGTVTATGGSYGAGIGGGRDSDGGKIYIYGGDITATGKDSSAGIGGGDPSDKREDFSEIHIYGGNITATGSSKGAGIGGGEYGRADITINGGYITATGGSGAGIGSGADGECSTITIKGGDIDATAVNKSAFGIGNGMNTTESASCVIHLGYDDDTKERIQITASFGGEVTIDNPFRSSNHIFLEGVVSDNKYLNDGLLVAWDPTKMTWADLQLMINDAANEETVMLYAHVRATEDDKCLTVPTGKNIVLDLNGHTLDRNLINDYEDNGCAIKVERDAKLTIRDTDQYESGYITGGRNTGNGGAIYNAGTLSIESGTIVNCKAQKSGGAIYNAGTLFITGGTITKCVTDIGGGGVFNGGTLIVSGGTISSCEALKADGYEEHILTGFGGGIYNWRNCVVTIENGSIEKNAARGGGGVFNDGGGAETNSAELIIKGGTISENSATLAGGGIYLSYGTADITGGAITGNKAQGGGTGEGGGIYIHEGFLTLSGGSISNNTADMAGGGICIVCLQAYEDPKLLIEGGPKVTENTLSNGSANNIDMDDRQLIKVIGELEEDVVLGVTLRNDGAACSGTITKGLEGNGKVTNFKSDDSRYVVDRSSDGEAILISRIVTVKGVTGSFNDKIKLNYYFEIPAVVLQDRGIYVTITKEGDDNADQAKKLLVKDAEYIEGKGYRFSIPLAAKEASDTIIARIFDSQGTPLPTVGGESGKDYTESGVPCSLMKYFEWLVNSGETASDKKVGAAARDYCTAAQIYFNHKVTDEMSVSDAVTNMSDEDLEELKACKAERSAGAPPEGVSVKGITAMLESDNTLRLYYAFDDDADPSDFTFELDNHSYSKLKYRSDGMGYLALDNGVYSNHLQDKHRYVVRNKDDEWYAITASVLTYARACALQSNEKVSNLGKALYLYNKAAVEAFGTEE